MGDKSAFKLLIVLFAIFVGIYAGFATPDFAYSWTKGPRPLYLLDEKCYLIGESVIEAYKKNPNDFGSAFDVYSFYQKLLKYVKSRNDYYSVDPLHLMAYIYVAATVIFIFQHCALKCPKKNGFVFCVFFDAYFLSLLLIGFYKLLIFYDYFHTGANDCLRQIMN
uniref:Uncharacterized protein n=1 Tax=Panagrolaimus superbus TaxID=310955 RepID=A0A914YRF8_9BILA